MAKHDRPVARPDTELWLAAKAAAVAIAATLLSLLAMMVSPTSAGAQDDVPTIDLALVGSIQNAPRRVSTSDLLEYSLTISNRSESVLPARALTLKLFVTNDLDGSLAEMEVVRFSSPQLAELGRCGNGRTSQLLCTNRRVLEPGDSFSVTVRHRHPESLAGALTFFAELSPNSGRYAEPADGLSNNGFSGSSYQFANPPTTTTNTTTTTTEPTTTTTEPTNTSTTEPTTTSMTDSSSTSSSLDTTSTTITDTSNTSNTSSTSGPSTTSTTESSTTSSSSSTTSTTSATTTSASTTSTPTTTEASTTTVEPSSEEPEAGSEPTLVADNVDAVAGANVAEPLVDDAALVLAPSISDSDDDGGGPPLLLIAAGLAMLALLGGIALAVYTMVDRDPPLVDIREWDQA